MASPVKSRKLRILLMPFFATSHIGPFTNFAVHLTAARPDIVEATIAVSTANAAVVQSALARQQSPGSVTAVRVATYPFPVVDGLPPGVENLSTVKAADGWRIAAAAFDETLMRPGQEGLIREHSPDVIITDMHFFWNTDVAADLGVPCVAFQVIGNFAATAMTHLRDIGIHGIAEGVVALPRAEGGGDILIPHTELPEFVRSQKIIDGPVMDRVSSSMVRCAGRAVNTFFDLEQGYCEIFASGIKTKPSYFVGPVSLPPPAAAPAATAGDSAGAGDSPPCIEWLDRMPPRSVVFLCFGSLTHVSDAQLVELALGLEASGKPFLWVIRRDAWSPPDGWMDRVGERGMLVTGWAPQTRILEHQAVGAFVTHCGWNSVMETVTAGVPALTWPMDFEQFIIERLLTEVLAIGERLFPEGAGVRSTRPEEHDVVPAEVVARSVAKFMEPGGGADAARRRVKELSARARAAVAEGGSSHRDLQRLIDDLVQARTEQQQSNSSTLQKTIPHSLSAVA